MPGLLAIIGADANPLKRELALVDKMAKRTGDNLGSSLAGGSKSVAMREVLVLMREISRGNWTRVPGSLSLLLTNLGIFGTVVSGAAGLLTVFASALGGVALAAGIAYYKVASLTKELTGLKIPDFRPEYIVKRLQAVNQVAEAWRQMGDAVRKAKEDFEGVDASSERAAKALKEQFEFMRKMNALQTDPVKRDAGEADIDRQEKAAELEAQKTKEFQLHKAANDQINQANAMKVPTAEEDRNNLAMLKARADSMAKEVSEMDVKENEGSDLNHLGRYLYRPGAPRDSYLKSVKEAQDAKRKEAAEVDKSYKAAMEQNDANELVRKSRQELLKSADQSAAESYKIFRELGGGAAVTAANNMAIYDNAKVQVDLLREQNSTLHRILEKIGPGQGASRPHDSFGEVHH